MIEYDTVAPTEAGIKLSRDMAQVQDWFTHHQPTNQQINLITVARNTFKSLATFLVMNVHDSRERALALSHLRTSAMMVNQAIIFDRHD